MSPIQRRESYFGGGEGPLESERGDWGRCRAQQEPMRGGGPHWAQQETWPHGMAPQVIELPCPFCLRDMKQKVTLSIPLCTLDMACPNNALAGLGHLLLYVIYLFFFFLLNSLCPCFFIFLLFTHHRHPSLLYKIIQNN